MQGAVAESFRFCDLEFAVEAEGLGPCGEVLGDQHRLEPYYVFRAKSMQGRFHWPVSFTARMRFSTCTRCRCRNSSAAMLVSG